ncbi:MAG: RNA polymerase subunit sigma-70, partial [Lachnospiraceae bacterium]
QQAILLRKSGMSNRKIAEYTGIPYEKVRYQCKKQDCDSVLVDEELPAKIKSREACAYCGKPVTQNEHSAGRKKRFCCDECRRKYWKIHRPDQKRNPKAIYTKVCAYCGKTFEVYGNKNRKYCCHAHYVADYFGSK